MRVAASSRIDRTKTSIQPESRPGAISGTVTRQKIHHGGRPSVLAASSIETSSWASAARAAWQAGVM
jgi:hypothetical protein